MQEKAEKETGLWLRFKNGDREAFATLYRKHILSLIAYGIRLCPDRHLLKDQVQALFIELWHSRQQLAATNSVKFYLFKALRYKLIRLEKNRHAQTHAVKIVQELTGERIQDPVETVIIEKETHESHMALLRKAIKGLTSRQQEVIQLRFYQGFSNEQIAELLSMNYQSVCNLLHRALCRLKDSLKTPVFISSMMLFCLFCA